MFPVGIVQPSGLGGRQPAPRCLRGQRTGKPAAAAHSGTPSRPLTPSPLPQQSTCPPFSLASAHLPPFEQASSSQSWSVCWAPTFVAAAPRPSTSRPSPPTCWWGARLVSGFALTSYHSFRPLLSYISTPRCAGARCLTCQAGLAWVWPGAAVMCPVPCPSQPSSPPGATSFLLPGTAGRHSGDPLQCAALHEPAGPQRGHAGEGG